MNRSRCLIHDPTDIIRYFKISASEPADFNILGEEIIREGDRIPRWLTSALNDGKDERTRRARDDSLSAELVATQRGTAYDGTCRMPAIG